MFEKGNQLAARGGEFKAAIKRALAQEDYKKLRTIADKVLELAEEGERWAVELLRDTLDGKPAQQIVATDTEGRALQIGLVAYAAEDTRRTIDVRPDHPLPIQSSPLSVTDSEGPGQRH